MPGTPRVLSRRGLLLGSLGVVGLSVAGGAFGLSLLSGVAPTVVGLRCLTDREYRTLASVATALFPSGGAFPVGASDFDLPRLFDGFLADEDDARKSDLKRALMLLEFGPVLFDRRTATFSGLSAEERVAHFESWQTSGNLTQRQVALALRKFLSLVFYDSESVWPHIGYTMVPT